MWKLFLLLGAFLIGLFALFQYQQSSLYMKQADGLVKLGKSAEAIGLYQKAKQAFPLRLDINADIEGAKLVRQSDSDYEEIAEVFAEFQQAPSIDNLAPTKLSPNEIFVPILMYHHIRINPRPNDPVWAALNVSPQQLDDQFAYLASHNFHTITFDQLFDALDGKISLPTNPIILTFDDSYRNFYDNAFPLLKKYNFQSIQFVITQVIGLTPYLTWDQILEMDRSGLVQFGGHTRHHPNLPDLPAAMIVDEVQGSKTDLEQHLHKTINWFAYPYGSYSDFIIKTVQNAGFKGASSTIYGANQSKDNLYLAPRIMVDSRFSLDNLARRIQR